VALVSGGLACGGADKTESPLFSINGRNCVKAQNVTLEEQGGSTMPEKTVAFTFDDGPSEFTADLSRYLKNEKIGATFFINGANAEGREGVLDQQKTDGHLLANHTHTHASLPELDTNGVISEVEETDRLLEGRVAGDKLFFRPPFGAWNENVMKAISGSTMKKYIGPVFWDIGDSQTENSGADWDCWEDNGNGTQSVRECGDLYMREILLKKRGVILMHDGPPGAGRDKTVSMVKYLVPLLKSEGYKFARLDEVALTPSSLPKAPGGGASAPSGPAAPATGTDPCK
jgi:peptidoglycan/xylan/chitin deacetylase (PgdA/CDA1 family)